MSYNYSLAAVTQLYQMTQKDCCQLQPLHADLLVLLVTHVPLCHMQATKATATVPVTSHTHIPKKQQDPYRTQPKNYVQLLQHITRAKRVTDLEQLVRQYSTRFDAVHVAAALVMLPKLYQPPSVRTQLTSQQLKQRRARPMELLNQLQVGNWPAADVLELT